MRRGVLPAGLAAAAGLASLGGGPSAGARTARHTPPAPVAIGGSVRVARGAFAGTITLRDRRRSSLRRVRVSLSLVMGHAHRTEARTQVAVLRPGVGVRLRARGAVRTTGLSAGRWAIAVCAGAVADCHTAGYLRVAVHRAASGSSGSHPPSTTATSPGTSSTTTTTTTAASTTTRPTVPSDPIAYTADTPQQVESGSADYWVSVPKAYDATGQTPIKLFVWLHGCGETAQDNITQITPSPARDYLAIADAHHETAQDDCYDPTTEADPAVIYDDIADVETHFSVAPRQIILGGYSSGGDTAWRMMFENANFFAGLLELNSAPFLETDLTEQQAVGEAARRFPVIELGHESDSEYQESEVESEIGELKSAGFPATLTEVPGDHYNYPGEFGYDGTFADFQQYLLPHVDDGWLAPQP